MIGNPEFRRNLWIQFSETRVLVGALVTGLLLACALALDVALTEKRAFRPEITAYVARWLAIAILILWAGRQAAGAVLREINHRTWDAQRLSTLHPWTMAWGKLFGATALAWTMALVALAAYVVAAAYEHAPSAIVYTAAGILGYGVFCQATGLLASMARLSGRPGERGGSTTVAQVMGLIATALLAGFIYWILDSQGRWFGFDLGPDALALVTIWHFALWAVVGVYRRMRRELQMRSAPWAWLLFLIALPVYAEGLAFGRGQPQLALVMPTTVTMFMLWAITFVEAKDAMALRQFGAALRQGRLHEAAMLVPLWLVTYVVFAAIVAVSLALAVSGSGARMVELPGRTSGDTTLMLIAAFFFLTRDLFAVLYFSLGRESQFAGVYGALLWLVLYIAIPAVMIAGEQSRLLGIMLPTGQGGWALCLLPAAAEALLCVGLFIARWRAYWRENAAKSPAA